MRSLGSRAQRLKKTLPESTTSRRAKARAQESEPEPVLNGFKVAAIISAIENCLPCRAVVFAAPLDISLHLGWVLHHLQQPTELDEVVDIVPGEPANTNNQENF